MQNHNFGAFSKPQNSHPSCWKTFCTAGEGSDPPPSRFKPLGSAAPSMPHSRDVLAATLRDFTAWPLDSALAPLKRRDRVTSFVRGAVEEMALLLEDRGIAVRCQVATPPLGFDPWVPDPPFFCPLPRWGDVLMVWSLFDGAPWFRSIRRWKPSRQTSTQHCCSEQGTSLRVANSALYSQFRARCCHRQKNNPPPPGAKLGFCRFQQCVF